jgi:hypothetical protein
MLAPMFLSRPSSPMLPCMLCHVDEQLMNYAVNLLPELHYPMIAADQTVRIYQPAKSTTQSGRGRTGAWLLAFPLGGERSADPLMGWVSSADTRQQLRLQFDTLEAATAYATAKGLAYEVQMPAARALKLQSYADNFR